MEKENRYIYIKYKILNNKLLLSPNTNAKIMISKNTTFGINTNSYYAINNRVISIILLPNDKYVNLLLQEIIKKIELYAKKENIKFMLTDKYIIVDNDISIQKLRTLCEFGTKQHFISSDEIEKILFDKKNIDNKSISNDTSYSSHDYEPHSNLYDDEDYDEDDDEDDDEDYDEDYD